MTLKEDSPVLMMEPVITRGSLTLHLLEKRALINGEDVRLTQKEFDVLRVLVQNEERDVSCEMLCETVWRIPMKGNSHFIRLCVCRLKKKLNEENAEDFSIFTKYRKGYVFTTFS